MENLIFRKTPTGKKIHIYKCGNGNFEKIFNEKKDKNLKPCKKCFKKI